MSEGKIIQMSDFRSNGADRRQQQHACNIARLRQIEDAGGKRGIVLVSSKDRVEAALAVGRLVDRARGTLTVDAIKQELRGTKRLDRYRLAPNLSPDEQRAASRKLLQNVRGYLDVAAAVARLINEDEDELKIEVIAGTSIWTRQGSIEGVGGVDSRYSRLAIELSEMARSVDREAGLGAVLARAQQIPGRWDLATETFVYKGGIADPDMSRPAQAPCLCHDAFDDWFEHWTEAPPLPSVPLGRFVHALFSGVVLKEAEGRDKPLTGRDAHSADFVGEEQVVTFELSREVRLALGPTTSLRTIDALLESRAHLRLHRSHDAGPDAQPERTFHKLLPCVSLKPLDDATRSLPPAVFQVLIGDRWHRIATLDPMDDEPATVFDRRPEASPIDWRTEPWNRRSAEIEHWYLHWQAGTPAALAHWFGRPDGSMDAVAVHDNGASSDHMPAFPRGTLAHWLEQALHNGGLERALAEAVKRMAAALAAHEATWRSECETRHSERVSKWRAKTDATPTDPSDLNH